MTPEELEAARQEKIDKVLSNFSIQLKKLDNNKRFLTGKVVEAKRLGLKQEEQKARMLLGKCLGQIHRTLGMQMSLELMVQDRDLSNLQEAFLNCLDGISDEIEGNVSKATAKKAKKKYLKAIYNVNQQNNRIDDVLETGDFAMNAQAEGGVYDKFDDEINSLVSEEEMKMYSDPLSYKQR